MSLERNEDKSEDMFSSETQISSLEVRGYKIPTDFPESDGTYTWDSTTMVLVIVNAGSRYGIGYTYGSLSIATYIEDVLKPEITGRDFLHIESLHTTLLQKIRNDGNCGMASMAISAVDLALWDLKARHLELPLAGLLGAATDSIEVYGSGGFTSYTDRQLTDQFENWAKAGIRCMKMKIGREPARDLDRVKIAKNAIGQGNIVFVDANGAYSVKQALKFAVEFQDYGVEWFEEPVSSDNLVGLRFLKDHAPAGMNISAGEYGYNLPYYTRMLNARAVDVLQADITRCGGITGFLKTGHLCQAHQIPFSSHCAPALHVNAAVCLPDFFIAEYFHDHARIENEFFDGTPKPVNGRLSPNRNSFGLGLELKEKDVEKYRIK
jgi:L-alanine-DL-glutamate epimerase-like enolase superfamily enzyme